MAPPDLGTAAAPWTWERGITGTGVKVAVLEDDGVAFDNPYLNGSQYYLSRWDDSQMEEKIGFAWYSGLPIP